MKIIVPIKQILDPRGITVRRDKERIFVNREEYVLEPGSKAAIEAALRLKDAEPAEVVALSVGKPQAEDALREALAMGCDGAYLLSDRAFEDACVSAVAKILAAAIDKLGGADLVVAGRESGDTGAGQIGPRLAEALGYTQVTDAYALAAEDGMLQAIRRWGNGYATVQASLPVVVTVAARAFPARYPHGARIMNAYREWDVIIWDATHLGLDDADLSPLITLRRESFPAPLPVGERVRGEPTSVAEEVVMSLRLQRLID